MTDYDMSIHQNPDAMAWTNFFFETNPECNISEDVMYGWFANSMMAMHDHMQGSAPLNGDMSSHMIEAARKARVLDERQEA